MTYRLGLVVLLLACACNKKAAEPTAGSNQQGSAGSATGSAGSATGGGSGAAAQPPAGSAAAPEAWTLATQPIELACGPQPLALPPPTAAPADGERALPRAQPIAACQDQATIEALCDCLVASTATWIQGTGLEAPVTCAPDTRATKATPQARLVELRSKPTDPDIVAAGTAFVVATARGTAWSAVNVVEAAPDVDLTETPRATHGAKIVALEARPRSDGTLIWIQSQNQYSETAQGEQEVTGAAALTICLVPTTGAPACHAPIKLAVWDYTFTIAKAERPDACELRRGGVLSATLDSAGALSVKLERGTDKAGAAGRYKL